MTGHLAEQEQTHTAPRRVSTGGVPADQLRSIVERIERMEEEKAGIACDIADIYAEAKGNGYDVKTLRKVLSLRKQDAAERDEAEHLLDTYCVALGMKPQMQLFKEDNTLAETEQPDELYRDAVGVVRAERNGSTSYLQRVLRIGYNRAARLMDRMETEGIVGPVNHVGKREVLAVR